MPLLDKKLNMLFGETIDIQWKDDGGSIEDQAKLIRAQVDAKVKEMYETHRHHFQEEVRPLTIMHKERPPPSKWQLTDVLQLYQRIITKYGTIAAVLIAIRFASLRLI